MKKITKEDQAILEKHFPKFTRIQACMVNNPAYGISLSPEAEKLLNKPSRAFNNAITDDLPQEQAEVVERYLESHFDSIKSFIIWMAMQHETAVSERLSEQVADLPEGL